MPDDTTARDFLEAAQELRSTFASEDFDIGDEQLFCERLDALYAAHPTDAPEVLTKEIGIPPHTEQQGDGLDLEALLFYATTVLEAPRSHTTQMEHELALGVKALLAERSGLRGSEAREGADIRVDGVAFGDSGIWKLFVNGYGVAQWPSKAGDDDPRHYADEVARVLRVALASPAPAPTTEDEET